MIKLDTVLLSQNVQILLAGRLKNVNHSKKKSVGPTRGCTASQIIKCAMAVGSHTVRESTAGNTSVGVGRADPAAGDLLSDPWLQSVAVYFVSCVINSDNRPLDVFSLAAEIWPGAVYEINYVFNLPYCFA